MKVKQSDSQELLADIKCLLNSAQEDYNQKRCDNYKYYISEFNSLLQKAQGSGVGAELPKVADAECDEVDHNTMLNSYGSECPSFPVIPSISSKTSKLREIINSAGKLLRKVNSVAGGDLSNNSSPITYIEKLCKRFHIVASQLRKRRENRSTLKVQDEYDVHDLLHALLRLHFDDVRPEEPILSYAGGSARTDFFLKPEQIFIEVKKTREGLAAKELGEQLIIDIEKYSKHSDCKMLVCFVYDPDARIVNPRGVEADLNSKSDERMKVITFIEPSAA